METTRSNRTNGKPAKINPTSGPADFEEVFTRNMSGLYSLAFLLTADSMKAISCVAAAMDECVQGMAVYAEFGDMWARRAVAKNAIAVALEPDPWLTDRSWDIAGTEFDDAAGAADGAGGFAQAAGMDPLERIVFVLCTIEGYSVQDCARLIGVTAKDVGDVQLRAQTSPLAESTGEIAA